MAVFDVLESVMVSYLERHERWLTEILEKNDIDWLAAVDFHRSEISLLQAERLAHLIVTMFVGAFLFASFAMAVFLTSWATLLLTLILMGLFIGYIRHYFLLENGLQRIYEIGRKLEGRARSVLK
ncbi:MAG: hypothetical protein PHG66_05110 [Candidatus Colwellbacteria bacterium]|nr:hypothetical protein [Candidatus Colwellbacteria bacterium]